MINRLLILSCSATKKPTGPRTAAEQLYDGPAYKDLRKMIREFGLLGCAVMILSAEHGLIGAGTWLEDYNTRMTPERARAQAETNVTIMRRVQETWRFAEVFIFAGKDYMPALGDLTAWVPDGCKVQRAGGRGIGDMRSQMQAWLRYCRAAAEAEAEVESWVDRALIECDLCGGDCFCGAADVDEATPAEVWAWLGLPLDPPAPPAPSSGPALTQLTLGFA